MFGHAYLTKFSSCFEYKKGKVQSCLTHKYTHLGLLKALYSLIKEIRVVCYASQGDAIFLAGA